MILQDVYYSGNIKIDNFIDHMVHYYDLINYLSYHVFIYISKVIILFHSYNEWYHSEIIFYLALIIESITQVVVNLLKSFI